MPHYLPEGLLLRTGTQRFTPEFLERAAQERHICEAIVTMCDEHHNLIVDLGFTTGIIPHDQAALGIASGAVREIALLSRVGQPVCFLVQDAAARPVLLSRSAAQQQAYTDYLLHLTPGDILPAVVTNPARFGAFCDIGCGLIGLLGIENISVSRIQHSRDRFEEGQQIFAAIRAIDPETGRITLTHKELLGTWLQNAARFRPGQTVTGVIRSQMDYGLFIELAPNLSGLSEPKEGLHPGDAVSVYIKSILPEKQKIKLAVVKKLERQLLPRQPIFYFETEGHLSSWQYGRPGSRQLTVF